MTPQPDSQSIPPRWTLERRLELIAARLSWEGRVNRGDLIAAFGISPNQATADLGRFAAMHPGALAYDTRAKTYRPGPGWPGPGESDTRALLQELRLVAEHVLPESDSRLLTVPALAMAEAPVRMVPPLALAVTLDAIRNRLVMEADYTSFSAPTSRRRRLEPHALVFDGFRWHTRARDADEGRFKDFVLARLAAPQALGPAARPATDDEAWVTFTRLDIRPHPRLSKPQQRLIAQDYGMQDGRLVLTPRRAVVYYVRRRLGLLDGHEQRDPAEQHIVLRSVSDVDFR